MFPLKSNILLEENHIETRSSNFFTEINLSSLLRQSNIRKLKGQKCSVLFQVIFLLIFTGKNLYQLLESKSNTLPFGKDVIYRFLRSTSYNWRKFLLLLSSSIIIKKLTPLTSEERDNVLIVDDTVYDRNRSKSVELLAKVFDHAHKKYVKGFRLLTLGWSDGISFIPVAFSLLSSRIKENRLCSMNDSIDKRTNGYKRRKESIKKATEVMFNLLDGAAKHSIPAKYVLFDSWFSFPAVIRKIAIKYKLHVVCRLKALPNIVYNYQGKKLNLKHLYQKIKKRRGKGNIAASVVVKLPPDKNGETITARIVFIRDKEDKDKWVALLTTDLTLSEEEIIQIYGKRWDIEVFFKMNKSYLNLAKEFQGRSYDMMFAHTTIVFTRYIMLALEVRNTRDDKTFGGMFFELCDELEVIKFTEALFLIISVLKQALSDYLLLNEEKINGFLDYFMKHLPRPFKECLRFSCC